LEFVSEGETAYDTIRKFDEMYLKEPATLQIVYRNRLERMKLSNYSDSATFFSEFEKAVNELKNACATVKKKEKLNYTCPTRCLVR
jgi:hypothetical protein